MNKNIIVIAIVVVILLIGGYYLFAGQKYAGTPTAPNTNTQTTTGTTPANGTAVEISSYKFNPATITVKVGTSITWTNKDSMGHSATADDGTFDTGIMSQGESKTLVMNKVGTFVYHCSVHPYMKATVTVTN